MYKLTIIALAAALGLVWTALSAGAQDTLKNKAERTGEKIENKAERAGERIERKAERVGDKIEDKAERAKDKAEAKGESAGSKLDRAVDKTKAKAREMKDKVAEKLDRGDTRNIQQALQAKGYNPGPIDGIHGPRTSAALRDFQKAEGLKVTGRVDGDTRARLMGQASTTTSPAASPTTGTSAPLTPSTVGSPSAAPAPPDKVERK